MSFYKFSFRINDCSCKVDFWKSIECLEIYEMERCGALAEQNVTRCFQGSGQNDWGSCGMDKSNY